MATSRRAFLAAGAALLGGCASVGRPGCTGTEGGNRARIGLGGDVMLGRSVNEGRSDDPPGAVWGDLLGRLEALDGLFCNLECCLSARGEPTPGRLYHFRADPGWSVPALRRAGVEWASLANNHLLDYGPVALADTRRHLSSAGIEHSGAGPDVGAAREPARVSVGGYEVAVVAFTDRAPTYAAGPDRAGTAYLDMDPVKPATRRALREAVAAARRTGPDLVFASLHWGPNWVVRPADRYRALAHDLIDAGADLVHGHSAHVVQGVEVYRGRPIIHDAGDFVDDYVVKPGLRNDLGFLFEAGIRGGRIDELRLVPTRIDDLAVHAASGGAADRVRDRMRGLSAEFGTSFRADGDELVLSVC